LFGERRGLLEPVRELITAPQLGEKIMVVGGVSRRA
jgi:hypothetical protein